MQRVKLSAQELKIKVPVTMVLGHCEGLAVPLCICSQDSPGQLVLGVRYIAEDGNIQLSHIKGQKVLNIMC